MAPLLSASPDPVPTGTVTTISGKGFPNAKTRLSLDGVGVSTNIFRPAKDGTFHVGITVSTTVKSQKLVAEQYTGGKWKVTATLTPLLTFNPAGGAPPSGLVITGQNVVNVTPTSVTVTFTTNMPATTQVDYGLATTYLLGPTPLSTSLVTTHNVTITGLAPATLHHFRIRTKDASGVELLGVDMPATTAAPASSLTLTADPTVVVSADGTYAEITFTFSTFAQAQLRYGLTSALGQLSTLESSYTYQTHLQRLNSLVPNSTYHYRVWGRDAAVPANEVVSGEFTFSTATTGTDPGGGTPPGPIDYTFVATGGDDGAALTAFIEGHLHKNLAISGTCYVTQVAPAIPAGTTTSITWLSGAKVVCTDTSYLYGGVFRLLDCFNVTLVNPEIVGTGYQWDTHNGGAEEQNGLMIEGGGDIAVQSPNIHDTRGDGIYVNVDGSNNVPTNITITSPNITRSSRNNITVNSGAVTITGGTLTHAGLDNIDLEPNDATQANACSMSVSGTRMTTHSDLNVHDEGGGKIDGSAVSACGSLGGRKVLISITNCSMDYLHLRMEKATTCTITDNHSDNVVNGPGGDLCIVYDMSSYTATNNDNTTIYTGGPAC